MSNNSHGRRNLRRLQQYIVLVSLCHYDSNETCITHHQMKKVVGLAAVSAQASDPTTALSWFYIFTFCTGTKHCKIGESQKSLGAFVGRRHRKIANMYMLQLLSCKPRMGV